MFTTARQLAESLCHTNQVCDVLSYLRSTLILSSRVRLGLHLTSFVVSPPKPVFPLFSMIARKVIETYFMSVIRLARMQITEEFLSNFPKCLFWRFYEQLAREMPADAWPFVR